MSLCDILGQGGSATVFRWLLAWRGIVVLFSFFRYSIINYEFGRFCRKWVLLISCDRAYFATLIPLGVSLTLAFSTPDRFQCAQVLFPIFVCTYWLIIGQKHAFIIMMPNQKKLWNIPLVCYEGSSLYTYIHNCNYIWLFIFTNTGPVRVHLSFKHARNVLLL